MTDQGWPVFSPVAVSFSIFLYTDHFFFFFFSSSLSVFLIPCRSISIKTACSCFNFTSWNHKIPTLPYCLDTAAVTFVTVTLFLWDLPAAALMCNSSRKQRGRTCFFVHWSPCSLMPLTQTGQNHRWESSHMHNSVSSICWLFLVITSFDVSAIPSVKGTDAWLLIILPANYKI